MAKILLIDDEEQIRSSLKMALERREHDVVTAATLEEGRRFIAAGFDLILLDVMLPDGSGVDLLDEVVQAGRRQPVVMISGHADIDMAVDAIRKGATDFLEKPLSLDKLLVVLENICRTSRIITEKDRLTSRLYGDLVGSSAVIAKIRDDVARAAPRAERFLITGESGTGKELVALLIHRMSPRADGSFVAVNCAALPSELIESELFGHVPGAFTGAKGRRTGKFAEAHGGSIFLDEISDMSNEAQAKLLRIIESRSFSPVGSDKMVPFEGNIIAASNRDLSQQVAEGSFREDLLYRLNVVVLRVPPLRDRPEDIPVLAAYFLKRFAEETNARAYELDQSALKLLNQYSFPGNVRELRNLMERVSIYCEQTRVTAADIQSLLPRPPEDEPRPLKDAVRDFEKKYITAELSRTGGNVSEAARNLGLERSHLYKKLRQLDISTD